MRPIPGCTGAGQSLMSAPYKAVLGARGRQIFYLQLSVSGVLTTRKYVVLDLASFPFFSLGSLLLPQRPFPDIFMHNPVSIHDETIRVTQESAQGPLHQSMTPVRRTCICPALCPSSPPHLS